MTRQITCGIDVGSSAVKCVLLEEIDSTRRILAHVTERLRHRNVTEVAALVRDRALAEARLVAEDLAYVASTGEGEQVSFRTGHFFGMTTHARGAVELVPQARACLDIGALHTRAIVFDERGRVLSHRMTSQCASGSGQFLENIGRYLGVALEEIGSLSCSSTKPEKCSSICAVLAETDVINMVSRGLAVEDILCGIHQSMAGRFMKLLQSAGATGTVAITGGLAADRGLLAALREEGKKQNANVELVAHADAIHAGALGAALWGGHRMRKLAALGVGAVGP